MEIILATENRHKYEEISRILDKHKILLPSDLGLEYSFEENGKTYFDNAFGKALTLHKMTGKPVIADDSGLSVIALEGAPGLYSARYGSKEAGRMLSDKEKCQLILEQMSNITDREAFFVCNIVYMTSPYRFFCFQETVQGKINHKPVGENGFGYDPIFFIDEYEKTVAELEPNFKDKISHRGKACRQLKEVLQNEKVNKLRSEGSFPEEF
ncbi:MAG: RdgB/HAM1 family non-canonical purine NTP pyrophosphatase [Spirochaetales bacterium]|nr:RdgB/HAM1 family non-canonical purine NTP pyrophosphatase [Spirochaetales bacterium]